MFVDFSVTKVVSIRVAVDEGTMEDAVDRSVVVDKVGFVTIEMVVEVYALSVNGVTDTVVDIIAGNLVDIPPEVAVVEVV